MLNVCLVKAGSNLLFRYPKSHARMASSRFHGQDGLPYGSALASFLLQEIKNRNKDAQLSDFVSECYEASIGQEDYVEGSTFPESSLQAKIAADTVADNTASKDLCMISGHPQGNYLRFLAEMAHAKSILEIGTYTGYSAVSFAESAYCEEVITLDVEPYYEKFVREKLARTPLESKVRIMIAPATESLRKLKGEGKKFDFIFIDANKYGYLEYYKYILDNELLAEDGVIACDNVLWNGTAFNKSTQIGEALHDFVKFVKKDDRVNQIMLPIRDGVLLVRRNVNL